MVGLLAAEGVQMVWAMIFDPSAWIQNCFPHDNIGTSCITIYIGGFIFSKCCCFSCVLKCSFVTWTTPFLPSSILTNCIKLDLFPKDITSLFERIILMLFRFLFEQTKPSLVLVLSITTASILLMALLISGCLAMALAWFHNPPWIKLILCSSFISW